jgi:hypothetical protein
VPSTEHSRVGVSIDVYSVECTDGSADTHRPRLEAQQNETEDVDKLRGTDGGEGLSSSQAQLWGQAG